MLPRGRLRGLVAAIALCGVAVTALVTAWIGTSQGLYVGKVEVVVHPPPTETVTNPLATPNYEAIRFAALIAEVVTNGEEAPRVTNQELTLADQGMRHETLISLVNLGGQWANDFSRPFIRVEAVDESPEAVEARLADGIEQVTRVMDRLQEDAQVPPATEATIEVVPAVPQASYAPTHRERAMLVTMLVGLLLTVALCRLGARRGVRGGRDGRSSEAGGSSASRDVRREPAPALSGARFQGDRSDSDGI